MKRIVICSDGTWDSPEDETPTHVMRLARGIAPHDAAGNKQVIFYDWGLGSDQEGPYQKRKAGATGTGIDRNIMDCYRFLVHNYETGDALYFFGFSRGAYTVRSLAGFIRNCGILQRIHAGRIPAAYALYRKRSPASAPAREKATAFRRAYAVEEETPLTFLGVWDTVGALGIPVPFMGTLGSGRYLFHDTEPSRIIRHARHAVAIDENRADFLPALWEDKPGLDMQQVWFAGGHSDIGGGYRDRALGDYAGRWIVREAERCELVLEAHFVRDLKPDHRGPLHNEYKGLYRVLRRKANREIGIPMIHRSVKQRWEDRAVPYKSPVFKAVLDQAGNDRPAIEWVE